MITALIDEARSLPNEDLIKFIDILQKEREARESAYKERLWEDVRTALRRFDAAGFNFNIFNNYDIHYEELNLSDPGSICYTYVKKKKGMNNYENIERLP